MESSNNVATAVGIVETPAALSHSHRGENFYNFILKINRLSNIADHIVVTISEKLLGIVEILPGREVEISGQFRSYNNYNGEGNKLILTLFVHDIKEADEFSDMENPNRIYLNGYICKQPVYRTTPFGREITDIILAVNRPHGKSDYIPCICWGRNAKYVQSLQVGDNIEITGRIQSRDYQKKLENGDSITKTAFEVSVSRLRLRCEELI